MGTEWVFGSWIITMVICVPIFISGIRRRKWIRTILTGLPILLFIIIVISFTYRFYMASSPTWVYKQAFSRLPYNTERILQAEYRFGTDFTSIYLKFETTDANVIESLDDSIREVSRSDFRITTGGDHPVWFKPLENSQTLFYKNTFFDSPKMFLSYSKDKGLIYFHSMAGD